MGRGLGAIVFVAAMAATAAAQTVNYGAGFAGATVTYNGNASLQGSVARLTPAANDQVGSVWHNTALDVTSFQTQFDFVIPAGSAPTADGLTFCIQRVGTAALGGLGGGLGYTGLATSVMVKFDLYQNTSEGINSTGLFTNGTAADIPAVDLTPSGIDLHNTNTKRVFMRYEANTLTVVITDIVTNATATQSYPIDIPATVGQATAFAGFTAGTGGLNAQQDIVNWTWSSPLPAAPATLTATGGQNQIVLNWSAVGGATGYAIFRSTTGTQPFPPLTTVGAVTTYTDTAVTPGIQYFYQVRAIVGGIQGMGSPVASAIPTSPPRFDDHDEGAWNDKCSCGAAGPMSPFAAWLAAPLALAFALLRRR